MNLPTAAQNTNCRSTTRALVLLNAVWIPCSVSAQRSLTAILRCWRQPNPGKWTLRNGDDVHGACSFRPVCGRPATPSDIAPARWPGQAAPEHQFSPTQPVVRRSETGPPAVMGIKLNGASAPQHNRSSASYQLPATISVYRITSLTTILANFSTAPFLSKPSDGMAVPQGQRTDGWASQQRIRCAACRPSLQDQRTSVQFCQGAPCYNTVPDWQPWQPVQTVGPSRARGFPVGSAFDLDNHDGGHPEALHQWRATEGEYWLELPRLQQRIQRTLDQIRDPSRQLPARTPTPILEQLRDRIVAIALDMNALNQSCSVESATSRAPQLPPRPAVRRRAPRVGTANADEVLCAEAKTAHGDERGDLKNGMQ